MQTLYGTVLRPVRENHCEAMRNAAVKIGDGGTIAEVLSGKPEGPFLGDEDCWIVPGFIDAHLHVPQWDRRGIDGMGLHEWQEKIGYPAEARLTDSKVAVEVAEQFVRGMIANGTTTVAAFGSPFMAEVDSTFGVFQRRGLRAIYGMMLNDDGVPKEIRQTTDEALDHARALAARWHGAGEGRLHYAFSPRSSIRCTEKMMRGAAALAEMLGCYLQTHVAESLEEMQEVHERYPDHVDEVDVFAEAGMLMPKALLAHGVFLNQQQRRQVSAAKAALVHCPTANLFRESGLMDYVAHRSAGIRIALGSSVAGGPDPFMPHVAVATLYGAKAIKVHTLPRRTVQVPTPAEGWWMLTKGAADALSMSERIGLIEKGYQADCLVVRPATWIRELPVEQQISALLYTIEPGQIEHVFIAGKRVGPARD